VTRWGAAGGKAGTAFFEAAGGLQLRWAGG